MTISARMAINKRKRWKHGLLAGGLEIKIKKNGPCLFIPKSKHGAVLLLTKRSKPRDASNMVFLKWCRYLSLQKLLINCDCGLTPTQVVILEVSFANILYCYNKSTLIFFVRCNLYSVLQKFNALHQS